MWMTSIPTIGKPSSSSAFRRCAASINKRGKARRCTDCEQAKLAISDDTTATMSADSSAAKQVRWAVFELTPSRADINWYSSREEEVPVRLSMICPASVIRGPTPSP